jgi:hypothetical protein
VARGGGERVGAGGLGARLAPGARRYAVRAELPLQVHGLCEELPLRYLTQDAIAEYLAHRFRFETRDEALCRELARWVHQRTEGNPLFMVNIVKHWVQQEMLREVEGQWTWWRPAVTPWCSENSLSACGGTEV